MGLVEKSIATTTKQSYRLAWAEFGAFLGWRWESVSSDHTALQQGVLQFVLYCIDKGLSSATISGKLAGIAFYCSLFIGFDPTREVVLGRVLKGWRRDNVTGGRTRVLREAITFQLLVDILGALSSCCYDGFEVGLFRLCMVWMFFGAFRVSELLGTRMRSGRRYGEVRVYDGRLGIWLGQSKTDPLGRGKWVWLNENGTAAVCPVQEWRFFLQLERGPGDEIFCHADGARVTAPQLLAVLRMALKKLGIDPVGFGTHSFRIGAATAAARLGWSWDRIRQIGRWNSRCCERYVRK